MISTVGAMPVAFLAMLVRTLRDHDESWPETLDRDNLDEEQKAARASLRQRWEDNRALIAQDVKNAARRLGFDVDERGYPLDTRTLEPEPGDSPGPLAPSSLDEFMGKLGPVFDILVEKMRREGESSRGMREDGTLRFRQVVPVQAVDGTIRALFALDMEGELRFCVLTRESIEEALQNHGDDWNLRWSSVESRL